jgi:hypothetical protein
MLNGENLWVLDGHIGGSPTIILPMNPANTCEGLRDDNNIDKYFYRLLATPSGTLEVAGEDVVHFKFTDQKNFYRRQGRLFE